MISAELAWTVWLPPLIIAPFAGSFLGVLIARLPAARPVGFVRSACERCGRTLSPIELLPLVSFLLQRGRCRACDAPISVRHPATELAALAIAAWAALLMPDGIMLWLTCILGWGLLALAWIDWTAMILPDVLTMPLLAAGLAATWLTAPDEFQDHLIAVVLGYLAFRAVALGYRRFRGREGLGQGDAKLLAAAGAWVGPTALPMVVLGGAVAGLGVALLLHARGRAVGGTIPLPFGPPLALAVWLVWLYAPA